MKFMVCGNWFVMVVSVILPVLHFFPLSLCRLQKIGGDLT